MPLSEYSKEIIEAELALNSFFFNSNFGLVCLKQTTEVGFTGITEKNRKTPASDESIPKRDQQSRFFSICDSINKNKKGREGRKPRKMRE